MHWARLAPELSATVTMVRSWIMRVPPWRSPGSFDDPDEPPPLVLGHRARLHEPDHVADAALVLLVVHLELLPTTHVAAEGGMLHEPLDGHDNSLVHAVAHHLAHAHLPSTAFRRGRHVVRPALLGRDACARFTSWPPKRRPSASR